MSDKIRLLLISTLVFALAQAGTVTVWAQDGSTLPNLNLAASTAGFLLLLPLGLILFLSSALPNAEIIGPQAATTAFVTWGVATLAYFGAGFAFQFGGLAVNNAHPDFAELYWNWSPLAASFGTGWGVIGLRGWALLGPAATPGVYDLFLRHVALLGVVTVPPAFLLFPQARSRIALAFAVLAGTLIYPPVGNWVWSSGWLANLGGNLNLGHGFVDAGIATPFVIAGVICLAVALVYKPKAETSPLPPGQFPEVPMPPAYLPLLSFFGLGMALWSWAFIANGQHIPTAVNIAMPRSALNGILGAMTGGVAAALYSRFTTAAFNPLMSARGALAGLIIVSAAAPFMAPWQAVAAGGAAGFLLPLLIYGVDHALKLADFTASIAGFGVIGALALLMVAVAADGSAGAGWNNVGAANYLGVTGQGVSGLAVASGYAPDWPGQMNAQLIGGLAVIGWVFLLSMGLFKGEAWLARPGKGSPTGDEAIAVTAAGEDSPPAEAAPAGESGG